MPVFYAQNPTNMYERGKNMDLQKLFGKAPLTGKKTQEIFDESIFAELFAGAGNETEEWREEETLEDYLKKEEKIQNLQRNHEVKEKPAESKLYQKFYRKYGATSNWDCILEFLCKQVIMPLLAAIEVEDTRKDALAKLKSYCGDNVELSYGIFPGASRVFRCLLKSEVIPAILKISCKDSDGLKDYYCSVSKCLRKKQRNGSYRLRGQKEYYHVWDAWCVTGAVACRIIQQLFDSYMEQVTDRNEDMVYQSAMQKVRNWFSNYGFLKNGFFFVASEVAAKYAEVLPFVEENFDCGTVFCNEASSQKGMEERHLWMLTPFLECLSPDDWFSKQNCRDGSVWMSSIYGELMKQLVKAWSLKQKLKDYKRNVERTATVYMTKKNIPEKYLQEMKKSGFLDYFGYVEIDEDCDISAVREIEKEFHAIWTIHFSGYECKDNCIRFRKLGRHKAAGLYFFNLGCLCVDIRYPHSTIHECFHMLDHKFDDRSMKFSFKQILDRYSDLVREAVEHTNGKQQEVLHGKGKYNLDYYLMPIEVFARCGEIYMRKILGVDNSLIGDCTGFEYPCEDQELLDFIRLYYDRFLEEIKNGVIQKKESLQSQPHVADRINSTECMKGESDS